MGVIEIVTIERCCLFRKLEKLSLKCIRIYEIVERVSLAAYQLYLFEELLKIHEVFHVFMLCQYLLDLSHVLEILNVELNSNLSYEEQLNKIVDIREQVL